MADLTSIDRVRSALGLNTVALDPHIGELIAAVSGWIARYTGRDFGPAAEATEFFDGHGGSALYLPRGPVTAVATVTVNGAAIPARPSVTGQGWVRTGQILRLVGHYFTKGVQNVAVTYSAGYAAVPEEIADAATDIVIWRYRERDREGYTSKTLGNGEVIGFSQDDIPASARTVLDTYKRVTPGGRP